MSTPPQTTQTLKIIVSGVGSPTLHSHEEFDAIATPRQVGAAFASLAKATLLFRDRIRERLVTAYGEAAGDEFDRGCITEIEPGREDGRTVTFKPGDPGSSKPKE